MKNGYLQDFEGNKVIASCENCEFCIDDSDGPEYGEPWFICTNKSRSHISNLKFFPFKTPQKCCVLDTSFTVDWNASVDDLQ